MHLGLQCGAAKDAEDLYYKDEEDWVKEHELVCFGGFFPIFIIRSLIGSVRYHTLPGSSFRNKSDIAFHVKSYGFAGLILQQ